MRNRHVIRGVKSAVEFGAECVSLPAGIVTYSAPGCCKTYDAICSALHSLVIVGALVATSCQTRLHPIPGPATTADTPKSAVALPAPLDDMRMPWAPTESGFVRDWLICGPFPSAPALRPPTASPKEYIAGLGFETDYLNGEAAARPVAGSPVAFAGGSPRVWTPHTSARDVIDFTAAFADQPVTNCVAYAYRKVQWPEDGEAVLAIGSDDSVKVWVNGTPVHRHVVGRGVRADHDVVPVTLRKGPNDVLIKVDNGSGGWGFICRFLPRAALAILDDPGLRPERLPADPAQPNRIALRTDSGPGMFRNDESPVAVEAVGPGGKLLAKTECKRGGTAMLDATNWADGPYELRVSRLTPQGVRAYGHLPGYKGDWRPRVRTLLDAADRVPKESDASNDLRLKVLRDMVLVRLKGDPRAATAAPGGAVCVGPDDWTRVHPLLLEYAELTDGTAARPLGFVRLGWMDDVDGSPQLARAFLPPGYDARQKWPLIVNLHGYNPGNQPYGSWPGLEKRHDGMAERYRVIALHPHGRGNTSYGGIGYNDVVRAVEEAVKALSVDEDRIYLMGYSMGGNGVWRVGTRCPHIFAAIGPIYGGRDYRVTTSPENFAALSSRARYLEEQWSSFVQAEGLLTTPVFVNHGDVDDLVDIANARYAVRMMQRWGYDIRYWEHPGKGHGGLGCEDALVNWFLEHRLQRDPSHVRVRAADLRTARAHWVRLEQRREPFAMMHAEASVLDAHSIRLDTENVLQVRLTPGAALIDRTRPIRVYWNGAFAGEQRWSDGGIVLRAGDYTPGPLRKSPALPGLALDVCRTPFAIVRGTISSDPRMNRFVQMRAEDSRKNWRQWQNVDPRYFLDTEITEEQMARYSLLLFGGPEDNLVTRKLIAQLPLAISSNSVTIAGNVFPATHAAINIVYPNPRNPDRYVQVFAGTSADGMFFTGELPGEFDFVVADECCLGEDDIHGREDAGIVAGCFDANWQYRAAYAVRGQPDLRAKAGRRHAPHLLSLNTAAPSVMLSDVLETGADGSFMAMRRDANARNMPIVLGGKTYEHGICVPHRHELSAVRYDLTGGNWRTLRAVIGIETAPVAEVEQLQKENTRVSFVVRGDGRELYRSPVFLWNSKPLAIEVDVTGVKLLTLESGNERIWHCAARSFDWADVRLEKAAIAGPR